MRRLKRMCCCWKGKKYRTVHVAGEQDCSTIPALGMEGRQQTVTITQQPGSASVGQGSVPSSALIRPSNRPLTEYVFPRTTLQKNK